MHSIFLVICCKGVALDGIHVFLLIDNLAIEHFLIYTLLMNVFHHLSFLSYECNNHDNTDIKKHTY